MCKCVFYTMFFFYKQFFPCKVINVFDNNIIVVLFLYYTLSAFPVQILHIKSSNKKQIELHNYALITVISSTNTRLAVLHRGTCVRTSLTQRAICSNTPWIIRTRSVYKDAVCFASAQTVRVLTFVNGGALSLVCRGQAEGIPQCNFQDYYSSHKS